MLERKFQITVSYEEDGDLKRKNYIHALGEDTTQASLIAAKDALTTILGKEVKGYTIDKEPISLENDPG